jgi:hypothetical protein
VPLLRNLLLAAEALWRGILAIEAARLACDDPSVMRALADLGFDATLEARVQRVESRLDGIESSAATRIRELMRGLLG